MMKLLAIFMIFICLISDVTFAQALKQKSLAEMEVDLQKIDKSIVTTQNRIHTIRDANFLPDLYLILAELYVDKSRYMYNIKILKNKKEKIEDIDFANEKRPKQLAIETYQKLIDKFPHYRDRDKAYFFMGHEYRELGQYEQMISAYQKLTTEYPQSSFYAESLLILGNYMFEDKKDIDGAIPYYKRILNIKDSPFIPLAHYKLGWSYVNQGKFLDALLSYEAILTKDSKIDLTDLPDIYKKTDIRIDALVSMAWPYCEVNPEILKKLGGDRVDTVEYFKRLSFNKIAYEKALQRLGHRLSIKQRYVATTRIYFELLKMTKNLDTRMEAIENLYEAMKNSRKNWPVYGFTELICDTMNQIRYNSDVPDRIKRQDEKNYEIFARDAATRAEERAKDTRKSEDFRLAISAYKSYLWAFEKSSHATAIHLDLAESYFNIKDYVNAGKEFEFMAKATSAMNKRKSYLESAIESFTTALKDPDLLNKTQLQQARWGIRDVGLYFAKKYPQEKSVPSVIFNAGRSFYDERDFQNSEKVFFQYLRLYPKGKDSSLAVDLILDAYNQREDYSGFAVAGRKILANKNISTPVRNNVADLIKSAELRKIQTKITDFSSESYSKELLAFAKKYQGTNLGDRALFEAFNSLKSQKSPAFYIPGEELLLKHGESQYAKEVTHEMGRMALLTADFRRAAKYFETFAKKYPKDSESRGLLKNAALLRESMGDFALARKDFSDLGDRTAIARIDYESNQWPSLARSAKSIPGLRGAYYMGLANYRMGRIDVAAKYFKQVVNQRGTNFEEKTFRAHALYLLSMEAMKQYKSIQLESGKEAQAVQAKTKNLKMLTAQLDQVIQSGNGRWSIAALYGLGRVNKEFGDFIRGAPIPQGLTDAQVQQYKNAIAQQAQTYDQTSKKFFDQCIKTAEKFDVFTNFVKGCQSNGTVQVDEESETQTKVQASDATPSSAYAIRKKLFADPKNANTLVQLAREYAKGRDYAMANVICDRAIEIAPQSAAAYALKGTDDLFMNDLDLAFDQFKKALKINASEPNAAWGIAGLYKEYNLHSKFASAIENAQNSGEPQEPIHPFVRSVRM